VGYVEIAGVGDLDIRRLSGDDHDSPTGALDEPSVIGGIDASGVSLAKRVGPECLRGLDGDETAPVERLDDNAGGHAFDGIGHVESWHCAVGACIDGLDHRIEERGGGKRARRVMNEDDFGIRRDRSKARSHAGGSRGAASDSDVRALASSGV
jgi:hypothetical protein